MTSSVVIVKGFTGRLYIIIQQPRFLWGRIVLNAKGHLKRRRHWKGRRHTKEREMIEINTWDAKYRIRVL